MRPRTRASAMSSCSSRACGRSQMFRRSFVNCRPPVLMVVAAEPAAERETLTVAPAPVTAILAPARRPEIKPIAPERYKVQFTVSRDTHEKLRRIQDLMRHIL